MPTAPGYADCSIRLQLATMARPAYLTLGLNPTSTDALQVATELGAAWLYAGSLNSCLDSNVTATEFTARLGTDGGEDLVGSVSNASVGGRSIGTFPPNVACLIHKRTARGGRRGRGRMFIPWILSTTEVGEDGVIQAARITALNAALLIFKNQLTAQSDPMVILHSPGSTSPGAPDVVTSLYASNLVATQRRRLGR